MSRDITNQELRIMNDVELGDVGHENAVTGRDLVAASTAAQFCNFAGRCIDWVQTARSLQERAIYTQMGQQWLAAGGKSANLYALAEFETSEGGDNRSSDI